MGKSKIQFSIKEKSICRYAVFDSSGCIVEKWEGVKNKKNGNIRILSAKSIIKFN